SPCSSHLRSLPMKSRVLAALMAVGLLCMSSQANAFERLAAMLGNIGGGGGCGCGCDNACGCDNSCGCQTSCCKQRCGHHRNRCCNSCCNTSCGCAAPTCAAPTCAAPAPTCAA